MIVLLVIVAIIVLAFLYLVLRSIPDITRYLRMRRM